MADKSKAGPTRWLEEEAPAAISGHGGHKVTFAVACALWRMLNDEAAVWALLQRYNATKCDPPWSEKELRHKLASAGKATVEERRSQPWGAPRTAQKPRGSSPADIRAALAASPRRHLVNPDRGSICHSPSFAKGVIEAVDIATNKRRP